MYNLCFSFFFFFEKMLYSTIISSVHWQKNLRFEQKSFFLLLLFFSKREAYWHARLNKEERTHPFLFDSLHLSLPLPLSIYPWHICYIASDQIPGWWVFFSPSIFLVSSWKRSKQILCSMSLNKSLIVPLLWQQNYLKFFITSGTLFWHIVYVGTVLPTLLYLSPSQLIINWSTLFWHMLYNTTTLFTITFSI